MRHYMLFLLLSLGTVDAMAALESGKPIHVGRPDMELSLGSLPERICWYQDQKYSPGARIQQGEVWLICAPQQRSETNGAVIWRELRMGRPAERESGNSQTIRVGQ